MTVMLDVSLRPIRALAGVLWSSDSVHACAPAKLVLQAEFAPASPNVTLKLKRPGVAARDPTTTPAAPVVVVVALTAVVVVTLWPQSGGVGFVSALHAILSAFF